LAETGLNEKASDVTYNLSCPASSSPA